MPASEKYIIVAPIGSGAEAKVYSAKRSDDEDPVYAVRFLSIGTLDPSDLKKEEKLLAGLNHPNVVKVIELATLPHPEGGKVEQCLVMELIDGPDMLKLIESETDLALEYVRSLGLGILSGTQYLNQMGIAHRDLYEKNVVISERQQKAVIVDVGAARRLSGARTGSRELALRTDMLDSSMVLFRLLQRFVDFSARDDFEKRCRKAISFDQIRVAFNAVIDEASRRRAGQ